MSFPIICFGNSIILSFYTFLSSKLSLVIVEEIFIKTFRFWDIWVGSFLKVCLPTYISAVIRVKNKEFFIFILVNSLEVDNSILVEKAIVTASFLKMK